MFVNKLFLFTLFLLVREVTEINISEEICENWFINFPTKLHCLEYYKKHRTSAISSTTSTATATTTTATTTSTTSTSLTIVTTSTWSPGDDFFTTVSPPIMTSPHTTQSSPHTTQPSTTSAPVTNSAKNKTPWYLSLWAHIFYG